MVTIKAALNILKAEQKQLEGQLKRVEAAIFSLGSLNGHATRGGKRKLSAAGRARIAAAQRKRWAKFKAKKK
jgi:hypothetical protein